MSQKGQHTWDLVLQYHRCPRCGWIIESQEDFQYFFSEHSDVLQKAKPEQIDYLAHLYPELLLKQRDQEKLVSQNPISLESELENPKTAFNPEALSSKPLSAPPLIKAKYQDGQSQPRGIKIKNISRGGICVEDEVRLAIGTSIRLSLNFKGKTIEAQGEVAWGTKTGPPYVHGIKFTFMEPKGREWFNTFVMDHAAGQIAEELDFTALTTAGVEEGAERRSFARLRIPLRIDVGFNEDTMLFQAQIYDLSEGGLCLISNFEMKKGQELNLRLWLSEKEFIPLVGVIKYAVKKTHEQRHVSFHGVEFSKSNLAATNKIAQFLKAKRSELAAIEITLDDIVARTQLPEVF